MPRPLPERRAPRVRENPGLVWNKFFDGWADGYREPPGGPEKQGWIERFCGKAGDEAALRRAAGQRKSLVAKLGGACEVFTTTAPFVTGTGLEHPVENGFAFHHTLGVPYLPAASVKGLVRAWAEHWQEVKAGEIDRIFGSAADTGGVGSIIVFDALPEAPVTLIAEVLTPHDGGWRQGNAKAPSDWLSPVPIPFLAVAPGARFLFAMAPRPGAQTEDVQSAFAWLTKALDWAGAGARTAVGFGRFESEASRPIDIGDRVRINQGRHEGRTGKITKIVKSPDGAMMAQVTADDGGSKLKGGMLPLDILSRLEPEEK